MVKKERIAGVLGCLAAFAAVVFLFSATNSEGGFVEIDPAQTMAHAEFAMNSPNSLTEMPTNKRPLRSSRRQEVRSLETRLSNRGSSANLQTARKTPISLTETTRGGQETYPVRQTGFQLPEKNPHQQFGDRSHGYKLNDPYQKIIGEFTEEELETLRSLPPVCQSNLPGIDNVFEGSASVHGRTPSENSSKGSVIGAGNRQTVKRIQLASFQNPANDAPPSNDAWNWPKEQQSENTGYPLSDKREIPAQVLPPSQQTQNEYQPSQRTYRTEGRPPVQPVEQQQMTSSRVAQLAQAISKRIPGVRDRLAANTPANPHMASTKQPYSLNPHASSSAASSAKPKKNPDGPDPHLEIYSKSAFPSANECRACHEQIYEEWASSSHGYASISPMFHRFEDTINRLAQGTIGYFCLRCHAPVATTMGLRRDQAIWDGPRVFREGVTCVACHRVKVPYVKANGERRMEPGDIYSPVYGSSDGKGVELAVKYKDYFKTKLHEQSKAPGQAIHRRVVQFEELSKSTFCMSCHQVAVQPGIKLEVVWDQYRASPAYRDGVSCQDCHMGKVPGMDEGYSYGPAAVVSERVVNPERRHSNHIFYGPGYSIAHPGIYPQNPESDRWTVNQWLEFDWRAGWGTDEFEDALEDGKFQTYFPPAWQNVDDRYDARDIVSDNLKKLEYKKDVRRQLLENGSKLDGPFFNRQPTLGRALTFYYCITNLNPGHNMPSGSLGAQPQVWLNAVLIGPSGERLWETGYVDSNGDLADNHSLDVLARKVPLDKQLFNLQTKFLTTNVKGTDREMYLPVNMDFDQLPFLRPAAQPVTVINHPPFIRMEGHSLAPLESRRAKFAVPARLIQQPGTYRLSVRMRSRAEPIYFMRFVKATKEMERMMNEWIADFHVSSVTFEIH